MNYQLPLTKIGVLGGTFDPPHNGHLAIAQEALTRLKLAKVIFAPTGLPPHKLQNKITPIEHRVRMVQLAIANHPHFELSRMDVDRAGPTYTVDTIRLLQKELGETSELYFIMGLDSLANILTWHKPQELVRICRLAVFNRPGFGANMDELESKLPGVRERTVLFSEVDLDISATDLQRRIHSDESITNLVPQAVAAYIADHQLYRPTPAA